MADETGLAEATQPFAFQDFLERMKDPAAADLVKSIKRWELDRNCSAQDMQMRYRLS